MKKTIFTFILILLTFNSYSQISGATTLLALDEVDATISRQLQTIENLATNAIGNAGNMILSASARLRKDINETIGNTDKVLRENQLDIYNQILNLMSDFNKAIQSDLAEVDIIATRVTETIDNFAIKKQEPIIYKYDTQTFIRGYTPYYTFKVKGKNFDKSESIVIKINGRDYEPIQVNYNELVFKIDSNSIHSEEGEIHFSKAEILFKWQKGIFNRKMESKVPFIIPISPLQLGEVTVFYEQALPERKYYQAISYSCGCRTGASSWTGDTERSSTSFNIIPTGGKLIDPNTVKVKSWRQRYGGGYSFDHKTEQQIRGQITCRSESQPRGGGGSSSLTFTYQEFEIIYPIKKSKTLTTKITSINPVIVELPDPVDNNKANISYAVINTFDNKEIIVTPTGLNNYFDLRINPVTNDIVISWKR